MRTKFFSIYLTVFFLGIIITDTRGDDPLSVEYANHILWNYLNTNYTSAVIFHSFLQLYLVTGDSSYYNITKSKMNDAVSEYGDTYYLPELYYSWTVDNVPWARHLPVLYGLTGDERYRLGADTMFAAVQNAPRTSTGGFWHKEYYPNQMWLDGIYMGCPFYAAYNKTFNRPELQDDVIHQITQMYVHSWDTGVKLPCHAWYDAENDPQAVPPEWADEETGKSPVFWGRSIGWYAMALVDVLDFLPKDHPQRDSIIGIFRNLAEGIAGHQDQDSLVWWQVVDQPKRDSNWIESSSSCMFVYALAKGVRMGYIDSVYLETAITGYQGILDKFLKNGDLTDVCEGTSVGPDYAFYVNRSKYTEGRIYGHAGGAFILAGIEMEMMNSVYPPGLLGIESVTDGTINISWYKNQHNISGYILERKTDGDFIKIGQLGADTAYYADSLIEANSDYVYRICAYTKDDTSSWSNYLKVTSANVGGLPKQAFMPYPADSATNVDLYLMQFLGLKWKKGLLADYHKLYFGTTNPPPFVADVYNISYIPENLNEDSAYYWRVDEVNDKGTTTGETWMFSAHNDVSKESLHSSNSLHIFPNPGSEKIYIEGLLQNSEILVYDLKGMLYYSNIAEMEKLVIDIHNWQKGMYIIQIKGADGIMYEKLIKEQ